MSANAAEPDERLPLPELGERIRARRTETGLSVRELARRLQVSPSLISQIELGRATPSVGTLYAITTELKLSLDELFAAATTVQTALATNGGRPEDVDRPETLSAADAMAGLRALDAQQAGELARQADTGPVTGAGKRKVIELGSGVRWERLTPSADPNVDFLFVVYEPGGASCEAGALMRHSGHEYGHVLQGTLAVTIGFEEHVLGPGDSISFASSMPHRLATVGDEAVEAVWIVVGRSGDSRTAR